MGDPVPIYQLYQQPVKPQLTSSDHEVVATCRLSGMSEVGSEMAQREPVARIEALYRNEWPGSANSRPFR
jgi:hypothetical protein